MKDRLLGLVPFLIFMSPFMASYARHAAQPEQLPQPAELKPIDGYYAVAGQDHEGRGYLGTLLIRKSGDNYIFTWLLESGVSCKGVGMRDVNELSVAGVTGNGICVFRLTITEVNGRPRLAGKYATGDKQGSEVLTWLRGLSL